ncbi:peptidylprolyl isomerase [Nocardioides stalactiti]|uniref:peptidylprolyl isomerase n=1 Tax=Nocardioides stalactiti TaxID=2755356 RepID=UPI0015FFD8EF|nr:peptidylprolyl isomerase [Nocardioides stalactiti]
MRARSLARPVAAAASLVLALALAGCGDDDGDDAARDDGPCSYVEDGTMADTELPPATPASTGDVGVTMTTSIGEFHLTLDGARTPCTTNSMEFLVEDGFFDGTSCHRMSVSPGFELIQCGDPTGTGAGGPGYTIPAEFDGTETYPAGTLAMARSSAPDSGGSQFFICFGDVQLTPEYTVFGTVDQATMDVIREAAKTGVTPVSSMGDGTPNTPIVIESATLD